MGRFLKLIFIVTMLLGAVNISAQDIHFSQLSETPLLRNPALAGLFSGDVRIQTVFRSQWNSITDAYKTGSANLEFKIPVGNGDDYATLGGQILYDRAGSAALTSTHILPVVNFHKSLGGERSAYLSLAAMGGYVQRGLDRSKISTNSQFDGQHYIPGAPDGESFTKSNYGYFDATVGMSFNAQIGSNTDNNIYAGVAYHHLNKAKNVSFYTTYDIDLAPKWTFSAGLRTNVDDYSFITLEADFNKQLSYSSTTIGTIYSRRLDDPENPKYTFGIGGYYRLNDAFIPVVKLESKPIAISVSYDANMSELKRVSYGRGGFEISLTFQKFTANDYSSMEATKCPKF